MSKKTIILLVVAVIVIGGIWYGISQKSASPIGEESIKIGIITDLTGPAAYWGESTAIGAEIAKKELEKDGYKVELKFEDYQLEASKALTSAQKLVNADNVDAIYAEFNPAAISAGSFMESQDKLFVYVAAVTSPIESNPNAYKTYLDYQDGCKKVAKKFKDEGIEKIGMLKINLEVGELCLVGVKEIYGNNIVVEAYNLGDTDFKTQVLKMKNKEIGAIMNASFEDGTLNTLKAIRELNFKVLFGTPDDTMTDKVKQLYPEEIKGAWTFGFPWVNPDFSAKISSESTKTLSTEYGAAIAYTHIRQMVKALSKCKKEISCVIDEIAKSPKDDTIGFNNFKNRTADLEMSIKQY